MNRRIAMIAVSAALAAAACHHPPPKNATAEAATPTPAPSATPDATAMNGEEVRKGLPDVKMQTLATVYFDFDSSALNDAAKQTLQKNFEILRDETSVSVKLEGNSDERGSTQYNVALGQRRAQAVKDFLVTLGIPGTRLEPVSFGKEKPVDPGHDEAAWAKNRRVELTVTGSDRVGSSR